MGPDKTQVREQMRARRRALSPEDRLAAAQAIHRRLLDAPFMRDARHVMTYCSHGEEVDTLELIQALLDRGTRVCVPSIVGHGIMHAHAIRSRDELAPGRFGVPAPITPNPISDSPQVSLCPGVAFTPRGDRIGSGRGYYDRFLATHPHIVPVALAYDFQVIDAVPTEPTDQRMRHIVTESRIIDCGA